MAIGDINVTHKEGEKHCQNSFGIILKMAEVLELESIRTWRSHKLCPWDVVIRPIGKVTQIRPTCPTMCTNLTRDTPLTTDKLSIYTFRFEAIFIVILSILTHSLLEFPFSDTFRF